MLERLGNRLRVLVSRLNTQMSPLESIQCITSEKCTLQRLGDKKLERVVARDRGSKGTAMITDVLRGLLWVDEKTKEFVVVRFFGSPASCVCFCKKGDDRYTYIPLLSRVSVYDQHIYDVVLRGHRLYILTNRDYIRFIDLSGPRGFRDVSWSNPFEPPSPGHYQADCDVVVVNASGELLLVESILDQRSHRSFRVFKKDTDPDPVMNQRYIEVISLGEEALLLGMHTMVPGLEPNSIYFTSHDSAFYRLLMKTLDIDICVFNLATKTLKRFPRLSNMKLKDALWFLPGT